jgi:hypothetical protein
LRPPGFQNQRLHLRLALSKAFQIVIEQQDFARLELLDGVQPAEIDEGVANEYDESHAVRSGDEFCAQFDHLSVDEHFWLLEQQFEGPGLVHLGHRAGLDLAAVLGGFVGTHAHVLQEGGLVGLLLGLAFLGTRVQFGQHLREPLVFVSFG